LYQGRFKSFPIQSDGHLLTVMRYVERNPVRANFIELAEDWRWVSAYVRRQRADARRWLAIPDDPPLPRNWRSRVNKVETESELTSLRHSVRRGLPFGDDRWTRSSAVQAWPRNHDSPKGTTQKRDPFVSIPLSPRQLAVRVGYARVAPYTSVRWENERAIVCVNDRSLSRSCSGVRVTGRLSHLKYSSETISVTGDFNCSLLPHKNCDWKPPVARES